MSDCLSCKERANRWRSMHECTRCNMRAIAGPEVKVRVYHQGAIVSWLCKRCGLGNLNFDSDKTGIISRNHPNPDGTEDSWTKQLRKYGPSSKSTLHQIFELENLSAATKADAVWKASLEKVIDGMFTEQ